jgi:hypothetical protein
MPEIEIDETMLTVQFDDISGKHWVEFGEYVGSKWNNAEYAEQERQQIIAAIKVSVRVKGQS